MTERICKVQVNKRGDNNSKIKVNKSNVAQVYISSCVRYSSRNMRQDNTREYATESVAVLKQHYG